MRSWQPPHVLDIGMTPREQEEYAALRATIRERGTARVCLFAAGVAVWAALTVATMATSAPPVATLIPLLVLAASFEAIFTLHVGVERVGRYLASEFDDGWEKAAMAFGRPAGAASTDPLFVGLFVVAATVNFLPGLVAGPTPPELIFAGGGHALFLLRVLVARQIASRQRVIDLERFRQLKTAPMYDYHEGPKGTKNTNDLA
jgi:hypothetical protein